VFWVIGFFLQVLICLDKFRLLREITLAVRV